MEAAVAPAGKVSMQVIKKVEKAPLSWKVKNFPNYWKGTWRMHLAQMLGIATLIGELRLMLRHADGTATDYGTVSRRVVTTAGVNFIVDAFQNTTELETLKYHGFGTGGAAEAIGNTALTTELTTQYATDNTRPTGTTVEGASANIYRTVATLDPDSTVAITEHGVFSATTAGTLLDRSLFASITVDAAGDTLEATYELTLTPGS